MEHLSLEQLQAGLDVVRAAPVGSGSLEAIVARPVVDERDVRSVGRLATDVGLEGDDWQARGSRHTDDGSAEPDRQLTIMSARAVQLMAGDPERWPLAGDQLYVDLDLSHEHVPAGTRIEIGGALVEVTPAPHNGCAKFARRFGDDAMRFVNSSEGKALRLRGLNARVLRAGEIRVGDAVTVVTG